jgi:hypothetical protein
MILIQFPDRETEVKGLSVLMAGFSGKVLRGGLHIVPEPALDVLTAQGIPYTVKGRATYEHEVAALLGHDLKIAYRQMAQDEAREAEAHEWAEATIGDVADEPR